MKRLNSSDSLGALMSICPNTTDDQGNNPMYGREFQTMLDGLDEEGCVDEAGGHVSEKKRRLSVDQVKALEKNFEVENKLEPERKVKLAQELGLQPRQVAVWFQNRRARWKTKQLERDYGVLKANYDSLKLNFDTLQHDNESLLKEIRELKTKLNEEGIISDGKVSVKEEEMMSSETEEEKRNLENETPLLNNSLSLGKCEEEEEEEAVTELNFENCNGVMATVFGCDFKDGSSDSDSSAILNEDININNNNNSPTAALSSSAGILHHNSPHQFSGSSSSSLNISFQFSSAETKATVSSVLGDARKAYQPQFVKIEEHNFFGEESCSTFFSDDQAPTLHWYCSDDWN